MYKLNYLIFLVNCFVRIFASHIFDTFNKEAKTSESSKEDKRMVKLHFV